MCTKKAQLWSDLKQQQRRRVTQLLSSEFTKHWLRELTKIQMQKCLSFWCVHVPQDPIAHRKRLVEQMSSGTLRYAFQQTTKQMSTSFFQLTWNDFYSNVCSLSPSVLTNWWHVSFDFILWHTQSIDLINSFKKSTKVWFFIIHSNANQ